MALLAILIYSPCASLRNTRPVQMGGVCIGLVQSSTDSVHSVKLCISGNLSVGSVTLYKSVWHCIGKGWFADVALVH